MKPAGIFISTVLVIDTFLVSFAVGFNSRHVLVVDPRLPPVTHPAKVTAGTPAEGSKGADFGKTSAKSKDSPAAAAGDSKASATHKPAAKAKATAAEKSGAKKVPANKATTGGKAAKDNAKPAGSKPVKSSKPKSKSAAPAGK